MQLYAGTSNQFIEDSIQNEIVEKLKESFINYYRYSPSHSEINSWRNSLKNMKDIFQHAKLFDHGVILEYELPLSSRRLDCMITGKSNTGEESAVIVELKQWEKCEPSEGDNELITWVGNAYRSVLHPSIQVGQYEIYLKDTHTAFYAPPSPINLSSCAYLHNYSFIDNDPLLDSKFETAVKQSPLFSSHDVDKICSYLSSRLRQGKGIPIMDRIQKGRFKASKKLLESIAKTIKANPQYILLDEQLVVYDEVFTAVKKASQTKTKSVILIKGGPGTGKSVIALNLLGDLSKAGYNCHYATGSKAFTTTLRRIIGLRGSAQFKYFNSYAMAEKNSLDVLILDESHRIRSVSASRFTKPEQRSGKSQIEELLNVAKVCVFFIDDYQVVRPGEIGNSRMITEVSKKLSIEVKTFQLDIQFRCGGSAAFVNWINNTLGIEKTANILWKPEEKFDFKIFDSPEELENAIKLKISNGYTGRIVAGFCWDWSEPKRDGTLIDDVHIGDYKRPWNAKDNATRLANNIPKASLWAYDPNGINQIGCVYTAQGFEFDYVGVIFGKDIVYNPEKADWDGHPENSADSVVKKDKNKFIDLVKNTYRVLFSRGIKGCYVYFMDENTKNFFKSRIETGFTKTHSHT